MEINNNNNKSINDERREQERHEEFIKGQQSRRALDEKGYALQENINKVNLLVGIKKHALSLAVSTLQKTLGGATAQEVLELADEYIEYLFDSEINKLDEGLKTFLSTIRKQMDVEEERILNNAPFTEKED